MTQTNYADSATTTGAVYRAIHEESTTDTTVIDSVEESSLQASGELETAFIFLISDTVPFVNPPDWFTQLANELTEAYFWEKQNGNTQMLEQVQKKIDNTRVLRYGQVPTIVRGTPF